MQKELPDHYRPWMEIANKLPQLIDAHQLRAHVDKVFFSSPPYHILFSSSYHFYLPCGSVSIDHYHRTYQLSYLYLSGKQNDPFWYMCFSKVSRVSTKQCLSHTNHSPNVCLKKNLGENDKLMDKLWPRKASLEILRFLIPCTCSGLCCCWGGLPWFCPGCYRIVKWREFLNYKIGHGFYRNIQ